MEFQEQGVLHAGGEGYAVKVMEVVTNHSSLSSELQEKGRSQWTWVFISNILNRVEDAPL